MTAPHSTTTPLALPCTRRIVLMGVSGSGKSTLGAALTERLGIAYIDGDTYHPPSNVEKMRQGIPLTDEDRAGWLDTLAEIIADYRRRDLSLLLGCSALKRVYREHLRRGDPALMFAFLDGSYDVILARMQQRAHFFSPDMLRSQFDTLEAPTDAEAVRVNIDGEFELVVADCAQALCERAGRDE